MIRKNTVSKSSLGLYAIESIVSSWNISLKQTCPEIPISGSPQRTSYRLVIEDVQGYKYVLERISINKYNHKYRIAQNLHFLSTQNISGITPYLPNEQGKYITKYENSFWQLIPFIAGEKLNRPSYVFDTWRGRETAHFLIELWTKSKGVFNQLNLPFFSLKDYVNDMTNTMVCYNTKEYHQIRSVLKYLKKDFFNHYDQIPVCFCHGDFHPLNIIWKNDSLISVIDWEFMGEKIEMYDMANLLGCLGIEEPTSLVNNFALEFIKTIKKSNSISKIGFHYLFECMVALRFPWLAEWLKAQDEEMIQLEIDFLNLICDNRDIIKKQWIKT